jgi:hypothetical protein
LKWGTVARKSLNRQGLKGHRAGERGTESACVLVKEIWLKKVKGIGQGLKNGGQGCPGTAGGVKISWKESKNGKESENRQDERKVSMFIIGLYAILFFLLVMGLGWVWDSWTHHPGSH